MELQCLGCGDVFGSGGRVSTCFLVRAVSIEFLIDCGASSLIAMRKFGVDPNEIDCVLPSHLHGDDFAGLPTFPLDAQLGRRREKQVKFHLDRETDIAHLGEIRLKRLVLTHRGPKMPDCCGDLSLEVAEDGLELTV